MIVDSIMRRGALTAPEDASALHAARAMRDASTGCAIVTRRGRPVGIFTERDLLRRVVAEARDPARTTLASVMSQPLATIEPSASVEDAARRMRELRIKRLVVVLDHEVKGVVSVTGIAYAEPEIARRFVDEWVRQRWQG